ncbi:MAG TPA: NADH-quinone oxidoreductase subunit NuoI [Thermodesulforhabdus norvegica]|uniref:NADH-quinone oxidoreductase subunit I n=1 Tax=Thermodesulforhabdus norvegica TaxID=39841 RepID=A0A7C1B0V2_9BACT|nr:NADH-quinone oxidoreductase subunit NuoI [Deltaproteobacteria bacterium]MBW2067880.1 NADH-quinone oxidoreductase subunit NuoI [Deltaproteobacteria bacterium]HDL90200.1 NADH-quinone oxidoreductase subunit NuoI [Thermodesulforhabdus norvegica]
MVGPLIKGLMVTLKYFFTRPITVQYPKKKVGSFERYRGLQAIRRNKDGTIRCVACGLCEAVCPSKAITIEIGEDEQGRRYPISYILDGYRCIYCGFCEDVCPVDAIYLTREYENVRYKREELLLDKDILMQRGEVVK